ncbi:MAG TPA: hypothetical protein VM123_05370 [archaeon]|nr:hypothetical protein [archaeon]
MKFPSTKARTHPNNLGLPGWVYGGRYGLERYLYILQRVTGLGILLYFFLHLLVTGQKLDQRNWEFVMALVTRGILPVGEFLVFAGAVFHGLNGIRLLLTEFGFLLAKPARPVYPFTLAALKQRPAVYLMFFLVVVIVSYGAYEFFLLGQH